MVLKLEAAKRAIEGGVREVRIVGGTGPDALLLASRSGEAQGHHEVASAPDVQGVPGTLIIREPRNSAQTALSAA
jgi:hypothetical protein